MVSYSQALKINMIMYRSMKRKNQILLTPKPSKYTILIIIKLFYTIYKLHITELGIQEMREGQVLLL